MGGEGVLVRRRLALRKAPARETSRAPRPPAGHCWATTVPRPATEVAGGNRSPRRRRSSGRCRPDRKSIHSFTKRAAADRRRRDVRPLLRCAAYGVVTEVVHAFAQDQQRRSGVAARRQAGERTRIAERRRRQALEDCFHLVARKARTVGLQARQRVQQRIVDQQLAARRMGAAAPPSARPRRRRSPARSRTASAGRAESTRRQCRAHRGPAPPRVRCRRRASCARLRGAASSRPGDLAPSSLL